MYRVESGVRMHIPINLVTGSSFLILSFLLSFPSLSYRGPTTSYTILPWRQFHNSSYHFQVRSSASVQSFLPHTRSSPPFSYSRSDYSFSHSQSLHYHSVAHYPIQHIRFSHDKIYTSAASYKFYIIILHFPSPQNKYPFTVS